MAMRRDRKSLLQHRPVFADQRAILQLGFQLGRIGVKIQNQRSVLKTATAGYHLIVAIEKPTLDVRSIARYLQTERDRFAIKGDTGVPQARQRLSHSGGRDGQEESYRKFGFHVRSFRERQFRSY